MNRGDMPASPHTEYDSDGNMPKGMTIRERMAMAAMSGYLSANDRNLKPETVAAYSATVADALLAELERTREGASDD